MKKKFSNKLERLIDFVSFIHEFREVLRYAGAKLGKTAENDTEHSYQVAMTAWYLIEQDKLKLDKELCFMYALAHDLVEAYAGDTPVFDKKKVLSKKKREQEALRKIKKRFPHFKSLIRALEGYEAKKDKESKFVYAIDKLLPPIQIYLEKGKMWHKNKVSLEDEIANKHGKISVSKDIEKYWHELLVELTRNRRKFFSK